MTIALFAALARMFFRLQATRRRRAATVELAAFSARELQDLGLSHAAAVPWTRDRHDRRGRCADDRA
jgi:uncharacterized protein YjiS (DUF1127 family)